MDLVQTIEFEENFKPKLESKEGLLHIKEEKIDPTEDTTVSKHLSNDGKEIVKMDFGQKIEFDQCTRPKLECKDEFLQIKDKKIKPKEVKIELLSSVAKKIPNVGKESVKMDFDQNIEFEEDVKPKLESKGGLLHINQEKNDPTEVKLVSKDLSNNGKEIVKMDFGQKIKFEELTQPKLECKEEFLQIKEVKINPKKEKLECVGKGSIKMDFDQIIAFEEDLKPKLESKGVLFQIKEEKIDQLEIKEGRFDIKQEPFDIKEEIEDFKCSICDGLFDSKRLLKMHIFTVHGFIRGNDFLINGV